MKPSSDRSLLSHLRRGEEQAAADLYKRYARRVWGLARKSIGQLRSRLDAEDIVQSVFRTFFTAARQNTYDIPATADLWNLISVIALNKIRTIAAFHRATKRDVRLTASLNRDVAARNGARSSGPELCEAFITEALGHLPQHQRQVLVLRLQAYTVEEISQKIQRSKRTVERNLQNARDRLAMLLKSGPRSRMPHHEHKQSPGVE